MKRKLLLLGLILITILVWSPSRAQNDITSSASIKSPTTINVGDVKCMQQIGDYLYLGFWGSSELKVFDISIPGTPTLVNTQSLETPTNGSCSILGMTTANGYLYVVSRYTDKLYIVDVSDPLSLVVLGTLSIPTNNSNVLVEGNTAYISTTDNGGPLTIVDVTDPTAPTLISSTNLSSGGGPYYNYQTEKSGDYIYSNIYNNGGLYELKVTDVSNPATPTLFTTLNVPGDYIFGDFKIVGSVLYLSYNNMGDFYLRSYDISTPSNPIFSNDVVLPGFAYALNYDGQYLYAGCGVGATGSQGALSIFDITTPLSPLLIAQSETSFFRPSDNLAIVSGYCYMADDIYDNLTIIPLGCVKEQAVSITDLTLCPTNTGTTVELATSENGINYSLRDDSDNSIIAGPVAGDGNSISFNTGAVASSTTYNVYAESPVAGALEFTGDPGLKRVSLGTDLWTDNFEGTNTFTVEAWVNRSASTTFQTIIGNYQPGSYTMLFRLDNGNVLFGMNSVAFATGATTIPVGTWTHVSATYDGAVMKVYVNGVLDGQTAYVSNYASSPNELKIGGGLSDNTEYFLGDISDVRLWDVVRTEATIAADMNIVLKGNEPGLVANYQFSEGSGTTTANTANGNLYPGTFVNNPAWVTGPPPACTLELSSTVTVTVQDILNPTITAPGTVSVAANAVGCEATGVTLGTETASDNCGTPTVTNDAPTSFPLGNTTVTWTATDAVGLTATSTQVVTVTTDLDATLTETMVSCFGGNDGAIDLAVTGGETPYAYDWDNDGTGDNDDTQDLSSLIAGDYVGLVIDAFGCTSGGTVTITESDSLALTITYAAISCNGDSTDIDVEVTGGTATYTYDWDTDGYDDAQDSTDAVAGTYTVQLQDANGCMVDSTFTIGEPDVLALSAVGTDEMTGTDGEVDLTVTGGTSAYGYAWDNSATTEDLTGLVAGTYFVTVTDANGCEDTLSVTIGSQVGIGENAISALVYPNPTNGIVTVEFSQLLDGTITVYNGVGQIVVSEKVTTIKQTIDLSNNERGIYFFHIAKGDYNTVVKVVLQ